MAEYVNKLVVVEGGKMRKIKDEDKVVLKSQLLFEGSVEDGYKTLLGVEEPVLNATATLQNRDGILALQGEGEMSGIPVYEGGLLVTQSVLSVVSGGLQVGEYKLPLVDGLEGQVLLTDGGGVLSWGDGGGGGGGVVDYSSVYMDKTIYYSGELNLLTSSQYWKVLDDVVIDEVHFELYSVPSGGGETVVNLIRGNDINDVLYSAVFSSGGGVVVSYTGSVGVYKYEKVSLNISSVTDNFHGSDLVVSIKYHKNVVVV